MPLLWRPIISSSLASFPKVILPRNFLKETLWNKQIKAWNCTNWNRMGETINITPFLWVISTSIFSRFEDEEKFVMQMYGTILTSSLLLFSMVLGESQPWCTCTIQGRSWTCLEATSNDLSPTYLEENKMERNQRHIN